MIYYSMVAPQGFARVKRPNGRGSIEGETPIEPLQGRLEAEAGEWVSLSK